MSPDTNPNRPVPRRLRLVGVAALAVALAIVAYGLVSRAAQNSRLRDLTAAQAIPTVAIVTPTQVQNRSGLELPGRLQAFISAPIYARVPGYLKSWKHDIGAKVKAGELLAEIDTPDLDQQLMQARADLNVSDGGLRTLPKAPCQWRDHPISFVRERFPRNLDGVRHRLDHHDVT